ncbi:MAG: class I SAM-dependent methyltransferase [Hormoscilla sp. SP5CHS1]|nr:class I SAM-dependent methyltransferase [Hormoscilla sp. SP5CHS1]
MSKQGKSARDDQWFGGANESDAWQGQLAGVAYRFNQQYRGDTFDLPSEVQAMPIFQDWTSGSLTAKVASPFWEVGKPQKGQLCLDLGCGVSFLIYPWHEWGAFFYGLEISTVAREGLNSRGPQLNSKLFKGVELGAAHQLNYQPSQFDLAIATGWSCYYSLEYWEIVMSEVKRVLKPTEMFVFDILDPENPEAENWAILETYLGAEVFLSSLGNWEKMILSTGAKILQRRPGELFTLYKVKF